LITTFRDIVCCPRCKKKLELENISKDSLNPLFQVFEGETLHSASLDWKIFYKTSCKSCMLLIDLKENSGEGTGTLSYPYDWLLAATKKDKWAKWKIKQLNSLTSGVVDSSASYSTDSNPISVSFGEFLEKNVTLIDINILDVGCGPLKRPIYLEKAKGGLLVGLDPFETNFEGSVIAGTSEFIPLLDETIQLVVASSVIDHFFDWTASLQEIFRIMCKGGKLAIYQHLSSTATKYKGTKIQGKWYRIYENGYIVQLENKMDDPFHTEISQTLDWGLEMPKFLNLLGFRLLEEDTNLNFSIWEK
jgi:SAM-dependent methyltransferase